MRVAELSVMRHVNGWPKTDFLSRAKSNFPHGETLITAPVFFTTFCLRGHGDPRMLSQPFARLYPCPLFTIIVIEGYGSRQHAWKKPSANDMRVYGPQWALVLGVARDVLVQNTEKKAAHLVRQPLVSIKIRIWAFPAPTQMQASGSCSGFTKHHN